MKCLQMLFALGVAACATSPDASTVAEEVPRTTLSAHAPNEAQAADVPTCAAAAGDCAAPPVDACESTTLAFVDAEGGGREAHVDGTTAGAAPQHASTCGGGSAGDVVYAFVPDAPGKASVHVAAGFPAIVSARTACADDASEVTCDSVLEATGGDAHVDVPLTAGKPVFLLVDGYAGTTGTFTMDVAVTRARCGDGRAETPEACDDGNLVAGDGCSETCTLEAGGILSRCPGQPFDLAGAAGAPRAISLTGTTEDGAKTAVATGCASTGKNVVYAFRADVDGTAKAQLAADYGGASLHVRSDCGSPTYQLACAERVSPGALSVDVPVTRDAWFYVIVDGDADASGTYVLDVVVTPAS